MTTCQTETNNPFTNRGRINSPADFFDRGYELLLLKGLLVNRTCCQIVGPPPALASHLFSTILSPHGVNEWAASGSVSAISTCRIHAARLRPVSLK